MSATSRAYRTCRRECHGDATRKLLSLNLGFTAPGPLVVIEKNKLFYRCLHLTCKLGYIVKFAETNQFSMTGSDHRGWLLMLRVPVTLYLTMMMMMDSVASQSHVKPLGYGSTSSEGRAPVSTEQCGCMIGPAGPPGVPGVPGQCCSIGRFSDVLK